MKKFLVIFAVVVVMGVVFTSCKTHEKCPAYGKIEQNQQEQSV